MKRTREDVDEELILKKQKLNVPSLPNHYQHLPIQAQIAKYRGLYDALLVKTQNIDELITQPVPGLFDILKNAFALIYQEINDTPESEELLPRKEKALQRHKQLWVEAQKFRDGITNADFACMNYYLATVIQKLKSGTKPEEMPDRMGLVFIIYGNPKDVPNRKIKYTHFVDQFFHENYRAGLAFFDVLSVWTEGISTRKDQHGSTVNGTGDVLAHDFFHVEDQNRLLPPSSPEFQYLREIFHMYKGLLSKGYPREAKILVDALLLLSHELVGANINLFSFGDLHGDETFADLSSILMETLVDADYGLIDLRNENTDSNYSANYRDWDFSIRQNFDNRGLRFFDKQTSPQKYIDSERKTRLLTTEYIDALELSYHNFWLEFFAIANHCFAIRQIN